MVALLAILRWAALAFSISVRYLTKRRKCAVTSAEVPFVSCARRCGDGARAVSRAARRWRVSAARTPSTRDGDGVRCEGTDAAPNGQT